MSSDNGVYILHTKESGLPLFNEETGEVIGTVPRGEPMDVWRVAHAQGMDNLNWFEENQPYMVGHFLLSVFGNSRVYENLDEARLAAWAMHDSKSYCEYGVCFITRPQYDLS